MKTEQEAIALAVQANIAPVLLGPPGVGKSRTIDLIADILGSHCGQCDTSAELVIASIRDQTDFSGMPMLVDGEFRLAGMPWTKHVRMMADGVDGKPGCKYAIVFLDELSNTPVSLHGPLMQVVLDKRCGDEILPKSTRFVLAMNPPEQAAGGWNISPPLANRLLWLPYSVDLDAWAEGMIGGFRNVTSVPIAPEGWEVGHIPAMIQIAAFLKRFPVHFNAMPKEEDARSGPWPSSRTWDMAGKLLAICEATNVSLDTRLMLLSGAVGPGVAMEFVNWLKMTDIPDPEELLKDPERFKLDPKRGDICFAILASVVAAYARKKTLNRWHASWIVLRKAADAGATDIAVSAVRMLLNNRRGDFPMPISNYEPFVSLLEDAKLI